MGSKFWLFSVSTRLKAKSHLSCRHFLGLLRCTADQQNTLLRPKKRISAVPGKITLLKAWQKNWHYFQFSPIFVKLIKYSSRLQKECLFAQNWGKIFQRWKSGRCVVYAVCSVFSFVLFSSPPRSFFRLNHVRKVRKRCSHSRFSFQATILGVFDRNVGLCYSCFSFDNGTVATSNSLSEAMTQGETKF